MSATALAAGVLAASALAVALSPRPGRLRLEEVMGRPEASRRRRRTPGRTSTWSRRLACLSAGLGVAVLLGGWPGPIAGVVVAAGLDRLLEQLQPAAQRRSQQQLLADLPVALDLIAACLAGGSSLATALDVVGAATGPPLGPALERVAATAYLGGSPASAWAGVVEPPELVAVGRAVVRAADSGAALADTIEGLARDQRRRAAAAAEVSARRAGVLAVLPLGLCFLPAFVLIGVVPVVAGITSHLLA